MLQEELIALIDKRIDDRISKIVANIREAADGIRHGFYHDEAERRVTEERKQTLRDVATALELGME